MSDRAHPGSKGPHAEEIPITPIPGSNAKTIQKKLEETSASASPGFFYGRANSVFPLTWLLAGVVPSNKTGWPILLNSASITRLAVSNDIVDTYSLDVFEHNKTLFTFIATISVTADFGAIVNFPVGDAALTTGKELAYRLITGNPENILLTATMNGSVV